MSILETIRENLTAEGRLPRNYELPHKERSPDKINLGVGAMDGVRIYHFGNTDAEKAVARIFKALKKNDTKKIAAILSKSSFLEIINPLLTTILKNDESLNITALTQYANSIIMESDDVELVKLGIGVLGLFDWSDNPEIQERLITLGLYEEFTLYVVMAAEGWNNANDTIFKIAQNVDGWGKIHAVEQLEPKTDEIREWILRNGCRNAIMDAYLGLVCANKGGLIETLRRDEIENDLFESICIIMDALFDEGPVAGISEYEHAEEAQRLYLRHAATHAKTLKHLWHILQVNPGEESPIREELQTLSNEITRKDSWRTIIDEALAKPDDDDFYYAVNAASRLNIDASASLFSAVISDPLKHSMWIRNVYEKPEHAKALTELLENNLPLDKMATGMGTYVFAPEYQNEHAALEGALWCLAKYPNLGEPLLMTGLNSPVTRERNQACNVISEWSKTLGQPVAVFSPSLYETLRKVIAVEVKQATKKKMAEILNWSA